ncbi:hypothetical protein ACEWY4_014533 [Coilia grayii]|uniref:Transmembrane channel-like protein n=1 Tax=Coilia grayii TaxID=363190 RepID=A0ABD1JSI5_9TELE
MTAYYHTEIYQHLPSSQSHRRQLRPQDGETSDDSPLMVRDWNPSLPLSALPICMQMKRLTNDLRQQQRHNLGNWKSWSQIQYIKLKRSRDQFYKVASSLFQWRHTLIKIEGRFGMGVKAYFVFLKYLLGLNLILSIIIIGAVLIPTLVYKGNVECLKGICIREKFSVLDIVLGSGVLQNTPLFYGYYECESGEKCMNNSLLFLLGMTCIFVLSLVMVIRRTVIGYKHTWITGSHNNVSISHKIFSGWDFCIQDDSAAMLKHNLIRNELKMDLEDHVFHRRVSQRTLRQWISLYVLRILLNVLVLALLGGSFYMIFVATRYSKEKKKSNVALSQDSWIINLIVGYLPAITITTANYLLPRAFRKISVFEDYSLTVQLNLTLIRSTFLKLASLGIYILFLYKWRKSDNQNGEISFRCECQTPPNSTFPSNNTTEGVQFVMCWENDFGKQMYQLSVFDLLASFINIFFISFPTKWIRERYPLSVLARRLNQQFEITLHVLDLVYSQTVTWMGVFYCPLLTCIATVKLTAVFYMKKFFVLRCCAPAQKMFRTHSSLVLFHFTLLLGLLIAAIHLSVSLGDDVTGIRPSPCGPFSSITVSEVLSKSVGILPDFVQSALRTMNSKAVGLPLIMVEIVILTCFASRGQANNKTIERLKGMLVMCNSDKRFLLKQHSSGM